MKKTKKQITREITTPTTFLCGQLMTYYIFKYNSILFLSLLLENVCLKGFKKETMADN